MKNKSTLSNGDLSALKTNEDFNKKIPSRNDVNAVNNELMIDEKEDNVRKLVVKKPKATAKQGNVEQPRQPSLPVVEPFSWLTNKRDNNEQPRQSHNGDNKKPIAGEKKTGLLVAMNRK